MATPKKTIDAAVDVSLAEKRLKPWMGAALVAIGAILAYAGTFDNAFVFDDHATIIDNAMIRRLTLGDLLGLRSRHLVVVLTALNYQLSGLNPWSYHFVNALIHALAGAILFDLTRRTLLRLPFGRRAGTAFDVALGAALIWTLHPLQTESVAYVTQRAESMMGLFLLASLYCLVLANERRRSWLWLSLSCGCCVCGLASKTAMVPAIILLVVYDRVFLSDSFKVMIRRRWAFYAVLAAIWLIPGLAFGLASKHVAAAFSDNTIAPERYLATQGEVVLWYLRQSVWPDALCLDRSWPMRGFSDTWPWALIVTAMIFLTIWALIKRPPIGFLGVWFFLNLAPRSSVLPRYDAVVEHRMYVPLAAVAVGFSVLCALAWRMIFKRLFNASNDRLANAWALGVCAAVALALSAATIVRNGDYQNELTIWRDAVEKDPHNHRSHNSYGVALVKAGRGDVARRHFQIAVELKPNDAVAQANLAASLASAGKMAEGVDHYRQALAVTPNYWKAHVGLGRLLTDLGELREAETQLLAAIAIRDDASVRRLLGDLAMRGKRLDDAEALYRRSLALDEDDARTRNNLGNLLVSRDRFAEALAQYEAANRLSPNSAITHNNLGYVHVKLGNLDEARRHFHQALRLDPNFIPARKNLSRFGLDNPKRVKMGSGY